MTISVSAAPARDHLPGIGDVFGYAATQIHTAAAELWPGAPVVLERHVPGITAYVHQGRVGDRVLYGKVSVLGVSLVSVLLGACGDWSSARLAQEAYVMRPDGLVPREAAQLTALADLDDGPQVSRVAGVHRGVLFTEPVPGPCLGDVLLLEPGRTAELLSDLYAELRPLHRPGAARHLGVGGAIAERGIGGTFLRKFNGISGTAYVDRLGEERCAPGTREDVVRLMRTSVRRLRRLRATLPAAEGTTLAYGDLKPEHVKYPEGPGGRPVLLDPGLVRMSPAVDVAKLVSRVALSLVAHRPGEAAVRQILEGVDEFATGLVRLSSRDRRMWLGNVLTLWLTDTVNILSSYLSAPAALPLADLGLELVERAVPVCSFIDTVSADTVSRSDADGVWDRALERAVEMAC
ncbi:hypothetical protein AB0O01_10985 [Streptomyces sp. NPDC093252]|uniref:hypothetical protein n=1 Tax=Streptomyces sp. NPDC093252 TaxID=3154980 RepID=UPI00343BE0F0